MKTKRKQTLGRKKRGPVPPPGGRVRVTVNLPADMLPFVDSLGGRSFSDKIVCGLAALSLLIK